MATVADQVRDERTARIMLSMIADPDDAMTGAVVYQVGGVETLRLLESDLRVPTLGETEVQVWRSRLNSALEPGRARHGGRPSATQTDHADLLRRALAEVSG